VIVLAGDHNNPISAHGTQCRRFVDLTKDDQQMSRRCLRTLERDMDGIQWDRRATKARNGSWARYVGPVAKFCGLTGTARPLEDLRGPARGWTFQTPEGQAIQCPESDLELLQGRLA